MNIPKSPPSSMKRTTILASSPGTVALISRHKWKYVQLANVIAGIYGDSLSCSTGPKVSRNQFPSQVPCPLDHDFPTSQFANIIFAPSIRPHTSHSLITKGERNINSTVHTLVVSSNHRCHITISEYWVDDRTYQPKDTFTLWQDLVCTDRKTRFRIIAH